MTYNLNKTTIESTTKEDHKIMKLETEYKALFEELKGLEALGKYGTEIWGKTFKAYAETFKKVKGYNPHWARSYR